MTFPAQMRIGSFEILCALAVFGAIVGRSRFAAVPRTPHDLRVNLVLPSHTATLTVSEGHPPRVIGRSSDADVALGDPEVSRRHATLQAARGVLYLTDLGSRNGTYLNGKKLGGEGIEVKIGDHIDVGNTRLDIAEIEGLPWT
ncbi:MAG TPA: FHA domain-containing protein [Candidatus Rubrimentiphilum sp.]|nr:FHA domain-containing protein [Candidatus Rubrimentiphilum sp.]